eukprot:7624406-Alexandrium_andersonii.AAC.1
MSTLPVSDYKESDVDVDSTHTSPETDFIFATRPDVFNKGRQVQEEAPLQRRADGHPLHRLGLRLRCRIA